MNRPSSCSLRPFSLPVPYESPVSKKLTPALTAALKTAWSSAVGRMVTGVAGQGKRPSAHHRPWTGHSSRGIDFPRPEEERGSSPATRGRRWRQATDAGRRGERPGRQIPSLATILTHVPRPISETFSDPMSRITGAFAFGNPAWNVGSLNVGSLNEGSLNAWARTFPWDSADLDDVEGNPRPLPKVFMIDFVSGFPGTNRSRRKVRAVCGCSLEVRGQKTTHVATISTYSGGIIVRTVAALIRRLSSARCTVRKRPVSMSPFPRLHPRNALDFYHLIVET